MSKVNLRKNKARTIMENDQATIDAAQPNPQQRKAAPRTKVRNIRLSEEEYEKLNLIAEQCVMPVSSYIRAAALMQRVKSRVDQDAVREMSLANANLARLGNLLKMWISLDEDDPGHPTQQGTSVDNVLDLMDQIIEAKVDVQDKGAKLLRELS